jgi:hypothetical protein
LQKKKPQTELRQSTTTKEIHNATRKNPEYAATVNPCRCVGKYQILQCFADMQKKPACATWKMMSSRLTSDYNSRHFDPTDNNDAPAKPSS